MNEIIAGSLNFILSTFDALFCIYIRESRWRDRISCFDQDVAFTNVNTSEKQAKYPGGSFGNFWVGMCRWDPEILSLYQS